MNSIKIEELVGGALQEKFSRAFENVLENLQNPNTPYKNKRGITIKMTFEQNESRDDVKVGIDVQEKLSPQTPLQTSFAVGRDLNDGRLFAAEYGKQINGQMQPLRILQHTGHVPENDARLREIRDTSYVLLD